MLFADSLQQNQQVPQTPQKGNISGLSNAVGGGKDSN